MAAALTIAVLLAVSVIVVRIAAVAMRQTGLPENVARFQCISALTGTGFTTHESEMIVNYPIRRRVLVALMIFGNLGLVSVAATFIVAFVGTSSDMDAMAVQILALAGAIGIILLAVTNRTLDRLMCGFIGLVLKKTTSLGQRRYQRILRLEKSFSIAEHEFAGPQRQRVDDLALGDLPLVLLAVRGEETRQDELIGNDLVVSPGDVLVCYGSDTAHDKFEDLMERPDPERG